MALLDLWNTSREQLRDKHVQQLIAFVGDGRLLDGSAASDEFRSFLPHVPSANLRRYARECLVDSFQNSGLVLQDIVNEVGVRLGGEVERGRYRAASGQLAHDGLWRFPNGHSLVVEVKTTDAYRIDLDKLAGYWKGLIDATFVREESSSILIIVGRQDTGDLEAQIRGSRHAWDVRIISVDALLSLLTIKEEVEDPRVVQRIHQILAPREFTRLDEIVEVLFSTAEEIKQDEPTERETVAETSGRGPKITPMAFHEACIERITKHLGQDLVKRSRAKYSSPDGAIAVNCAVSREHEPENQPNYWFAFFPHQGEFLASASLGYAAFDCGSERRLLLIPYAEFSKWISGMWTTDSEGRMYWHVAIYREGETLVLHRKKGQKRLDLTPYLLEGEQARR